jgi:hypothetical protein
MLLNMLCQLCNHEKRCLVYADFIKSAEHIPRTIYMV